MASPLFTRCRTCSQSLKPPHSLKTQGNTSSPSTSHLWPSEETTLNRCHLLPFSFKVLIGADLIPLALSPRSPGLLTGQSLHHLAAAPRQEAGAAGGATNGPLWLLAHGRARRRPARGSVSPRHRWEWVADAATPRRGRPGTRREGGPDFPFTSMVWMRWKKEFILENAREDGNSQGTGSLPSWERGEGRGLSRCPRHSPAFRRGARVNPTSLTPRRVPPAGLGRAAP